MSIHRVAFNRTDGSIVIAGMESPIGRHLRLSALPADLAALVSSREEKGNGWGWIWLAGLMLDAFPCGFGLGFDDDTLV